MSEWFKYPHIERLDSEELEGFLDLPEIWVEPKIDGANASILIAEDGYLRAAKRSQVLGQGAEFRGLAEYTHKNQDRLFTFFKKYPNTIIYGEWLCLSGDTLIRKTSGGKNSRGNYMTLREMYRFSTEERDDYSYTNKRGQTYFIKRKKSWWNRNGYPSLFSLDQNKDYIVSNKMRRIVFTGNKEVYEVVTREGFKIKSTLDHRFLTNNGWKSLKDIAINDVVAISDLISNRQAHRRLGKGSRKIIKLQKQLRLERECKDCGITTNLTIHHKDQDYKNNSLENLEVLCWECHTKTYHTRNVTYNKLSFQYRFDKVTSITRVGIEDCYDIEMEGEKNLANFVANGFVVHNCKHTISWYRESAWNKFYAFDILDLNTGQFIRPDRRMDMLKEFEIEMIVPMAKLIGPFTELDKLYQLSNNNKFLIDDETKVGEGIVLKAFNGDQPYRNKYGRTTWMKIVRQEFKEKNAVEFGLAVLKAEERYEKLFADTFITEGRVEKCKQKILETKQTGWRSEYIGGLLQYVLNDACNEELWVFIQANKVTALNIKDLKTQCILATKRVLKI